MFELEEVFHVLSELKGEYFMEKKELINAYIKNKKGAKHPEASEH